MSTSTSSAPLAGGASSYDGRRFAFRGDPSARIIPGDLVVLDAPDVGRMVGQVLETEVATDGVTGAGAILGMVDSAGAFHRSGHGPFPAARLGTASAEVLEALLADAHATLPIGTWRSGDAEVPARLRLQGFNRHTFLCGQSGSGKTYALGVLLEQLLLHSDLRMVVLDPNSDFVRLGEPLPDAPPDLAAAVAATDIRVLRSDRDGGDPLRLRFATMPAEAQAAVLRIDPVQDRGEYHVFRRDRSALSHPDLATMLESFFSGDADSRALGQRVENLGLLEWEVWAREQTSAAEVIASDARATVLDLGGFADRRQPWAVALDVVEALWAQRHERRPALLVIDEAHHLCPAQPSDPLAVALTERLVQIAAEGRKFGLWLLLSTQRPSKVHPQVVSQCDNLALMRMNSPADVAELATLFGFAPPAMIEAAPTFVQGEVLFAGGFVGAPTFARMGSRITFQGGVDVAVPVRGES